MYKICIFSILIAFLFNLNSCTPAPENVLKSDRFEYVKKLAEHRSHELFDVFNQNLSDRENEYLKFLYSYMPLSDLADYDGDFYLKNIKVSIEAQNKMPWAKNTPEIIFKHFVLPVRVNNENLDTARIVFYNELKDRVKNMSMYDAAIEVNHWCHEKVEYRPADGRTSAPLATMKTAYGRCGEESTFTVSAMRSVGIPARQVYTPRWAHSDDNHAWVEVWADGKWYFLGACEPEPVLNLGWFNESASRAMLVHARAYGSYEGNEEINVTTTQYDDINVIETYAKTFKQFVKVVDKEGVAIKDAQVEYQLYNYAEFYPITTKSTDENGISYLTTGLGELLIWVSTDDNYGFEKVVIGEEDTVEIALTNPDFENLHWELYPPAASDKLNVNLTDEQISKNKLRLQYEDSIRNAYVSTFINQDNFFEIGDENLWFYVKDSRGNYNEIIDFIKANKDNKWTLDLLDIIALKDLRDTKAKILSDHLKNSMAYENDYSKEIFTNFILNPRIELEMMVAYKSYLISQLSDDVLVNRKANPEKIIQWIKDSIQIKNEEQSYNLPITPIGVYNLRVSDSRSRNIFFVALCRSFGIPARLEMGTFVPQYFNDNQWIDVFFDGEPKQYERFNVKFENLDKDLKFTPQYYHHFTLARFDENRFQTLELGEYQDIDKIGNLQMISGKYRLITSNRLSSGKILVDMKFFDIKKDTILGLVFPKQNIEIKAIGTLNRKMITDFIDYKDMRAKGLQEKSNIVIAIIQPDKEPSKHVLNDIQKIKKDFESLNNTILFVIQKKDLPATFKAEDYPDLPYRTIFKITDQNPWEVLGLNLKFEVLSYPIILIANPEGQIIFESSGYKIGIGNDILKYL